MTTSTKYVFSSLSESSLYMAGSISDCSADISFTNIPSDTTGIGYLTDLAKERGYTLQNSDINAVIASLEPIEHDCIIVLIGDDDTNIRNAIRLSGRYAGNSRVQIYCYSSSPESEYLIDSINIKNHQAHMSPLKLRRVLPVRHEIYTTLISNPPFDQAKTIHGERWINIVIAGLNDYGMEMLRASLWFCQMDGFFLRVDVFDKRTDADKRFAALCPGVIERGFLPRMGEDYYDLHFHTGIDSASSSFTDELIHLPETSQVFVDIGSDSDNIALALYLRSFYAGLYMDKGIFAPHAQDAMQSPMIQVVVRDDSKASLIDDNKLKNYKDQYFQIHCVGRNSKVYSMKNLLEDPYEKAALALHSQHLDPESFEMYEYFRRSSIASAIHQKYRREYIKDEDTMAVTEHRRWCAYMRSTEGYRYGTSRDDLARRHPSLTPYANLSKAEKEKDYRLNNPNPQDILRPGS